MWINNEYYEGKKAFREGYERDENPYQEGSAECIDWLNGYDDAEGEADAFR